MNGKDTNKIHELFMKWDGAGVTRRTLKQKLAEYVAATRKEAREAALRGAANTVYAMSRIDARDKSVDFLDGAAWMQNKAAKLIESTIEAAANSKEGAGDG